MTLAIPGFTANYTRTAPCIGVFGAEGTGKTRLIATASEWAAERGKVPGWIVADRKTRNTIIETCDLLGYDHPLINDKDFISGRYALEIAQLDREKDDAKIKDIFTGVMKAVTDAIVTLCDRKEIEPICIETGTQLWNWISFSHFGRKQGVGREKVWGPPKQDWSDLLLATAGKTVIMSLWERDAYKNNERQSYTIPEGPPHLGYTATTLVRLNKFDVGSAQAQKLGSRFSLDVYESQDNAALEGTNDLLVGEAITYSTLLSMLIGE